VEELAGVMWRKHRLRLAEAAVHRRRLEDVLKPFRETARTALVHIQAREHTEHVVRAVRTSPAETEEELAELETDEVLVRATLEILASDRPDAYEAALATLGSQTRRWWEETLGVHPDKANP
jgi:hypothetical protein